jgi:arsenite/tail-anchored protein-transporting ATPase
VTEKHRLEAIHSRFNWLEKRIVLVTGKGGVGRTTMTASMARAAAQYGRKVLVCAIGEPEGDYSPLARLYGRENLPLEITTLELGVEGCLLWSRSGHRLFLEKVLPLPTMVRAGMRSKSLGRLLDAAPSFNEMGVFYNLLSLIAQKDSDGEPTYDLVLVDMPATGHSLALTGLPDILLRLMPTGPIADLLREGQHYLNNPEISVACVVTLPETLPVTECLELIDGLRVSRMPVGSIVVNKVVDDRFNEAERQALTKAIDGKPYFGSTRFLAMAQIERSIQRLEQYGGVPMVKVPEFAQVGDSLIDAVTASLQPEGT